MMEEEKILWITESEARFMERVLTQHKQIKSVFDKEFPYEYVMPIQKLQNLIDVFKKEKLSHP